MPNRKMRGDGSVQPGQELLEGTTVEAWNACCCTAAVGDVLYSYKERTVSQGLKGKFYFLIGKSDI